MKKIIFMFLFLCILLISFDTVSSHPGNTDENGGHHCWSNCEKWGLEYGEYHYHNGGNEEVDIIDTYEGDEIFFVWDFPVECEHLYYIGTLEEMESCYEISYEYGYDQGYYDYGLTDEFDLSDANKYDYPSYEKGYDDGWYDAKENKTSSYDAETVLNMLDFDKENNQEKGNKNNLETYLFFVLIGIAVIIFLLIILIRKR